MKTNLYTIYDSKAKFYYVPFAQQNEAVLVRTVEQMRNDPNSTLCTNPEDFSVFFYGTFDDSNAQLDIEIPPAHILNVHELQLRVPETSTTED